MRVSLVAQRSGVTWTARRLWPALLVLAVLASLLTVAPIVRAPAAGAATAVMTATATPGAVDPKREATALLGASAGRPSLVDPLEPLVPIPVHTRLTAGLPGADTSFYSPYVRTRVGTERLTTYSGADFPWVQVVVQAWDREYLTDLAPTNVTWLMSTLGETAGNWQNGGVTTDGRLADAIQALVTADSALPHDSLQRPLFLVTTVSNGKAGPVVFGPRDRAALAKLGVTASAAGTDLMTNGLSAFGTYGTAPGTAWQCVSPRTADIAASSGATATAPKATPCDMSGYLALNGSVDTSSQLGYWSFNPFQYKAFDLHDTSAWNSNTIRVGGSTFATGNYSTVVSNRQNVGGFQLVVLGRDLTYQTARFYPTRYLKLPSTADVWDWSSLDGLSSALGFYRGKDVLIFLASNNVALPTFAPNQMSTLLPAGSAGFDSYNRFVRVARGLGGVSEALYGSADYDLVAQGRGGLHTAAALGITDPQLTAQVTPPAMEDSSARHPASVPTLRGMLAPSHWDRSWSLVLAPGDAQQDQDVLPNLPRPGVEQAYAGNYPVPAGCHPPEVVSGPGCDADQMKAFQWWGTKLVAGCSTTCANSLRDLYRNGTMVDWNHTLDCGGGACNDYTVAGCPTSTNAPLTAFAPSLGFSCAAYTAVRQELEHEYESAVRVHTLASSAGDVATAMTSAATTALLTAWTSTTSELKKQQAYNATKDNTQLAISLVTAGVLSLAHFGHVGETVENFAAAAWFASEGWLESPEGEDWQIHATVANIAADILSHNNTTSTILQASSAATFLGDVLDLTYTDHDMLLGFGSHGATASDPWYVDPAAPPATGAAADSAADSVYQQFLSRLFQVGESRRSPSSNAFDWGYEDSSITSAPIHVFDHVVNDSSGLPGGYPSWVSVPDAWNADSPAAPAGPKRPSVDYDITLIGTAPLLKKLIIQSPDKPLPVPQVILKALSDAGVYLPDVLHRWGIPGTACNAYPPAPLIANWKEPGACFVAGQTGIDASIPY